MTRELLNEDFSNNYKRAKLYTKNCQMDKVNSRDFILKSVVALSEAINNNYQNEL